MGLPCASAKRSRLLLEVFDDIGCRLSLRDEATIEMNETVFALNFLETGGTVDAKSCEK